MNGNILKILLVFLVLAGVMFASWKFIFSGGGTVITEEAAAGNPALSKGADITESP